MYYVNDKELKEFPDFEKFYKEKMAEIKARVHIPQGEKHYVFIDPRPTRFGNDGKKEPKQNIVFPSESSYEGARWTYCTSSTVDQKGVRKYNPAILRFNEHERLDPDKIADAERIFFYLHLSQVVKNRLRLQNLEEDAKVKNIQHSEELDVEWLIKSKHSPISIENTESEDTIRTIASSWFIPDVEKITIEILKNKLLEQVKMSEKNKASTGRGYKEFVFEAYNVSKVQLKSDIQRAQDSGLIEYFDLKWRYKQNQKTICVLSPSYYSNPFRGLEDYLTKTENVREEFDSLVSALVKKQFVGRVGKIGDEEIIDNRHIPEELKDITREEVISMIHGKKKKLATQLGIFNKPTDKSEDLTNKILEKLEI